MAFKAALRALRRKVPGQRPILHLLRATGLVPKSAWIHLGFHGTFRSRVGRFPFRLNHFGVQVENSIFWAGVGGDFEATSLLAWSLLSRDARVIYDIGANSGLFSVISSAVNPSAEVVAFEPLRRIAEKIAINARLNAHPIRIETIALTDRDGSATLYDSDLAHEYSASIEPDWISDAHPATEIQVTAARLDTYIDRHGGVVPDLVKLDVERHEPAVLRGFASRIDPASPPHMIVEILDDSTARGIAAALANIDYRVFAIHEGMGIARIPKIEKSPHFNILLLGAAAPPVFDRDFISHRDIAAAVDAL